MQQFYNRGKSDLDLLLSNLLCLQYVFKTFVKNTFHKDDFEYVRTIQDKILLLKTMIKCGLSLENYSRRSRIAQFKLEQLLYLDIPIEYNEHSDMVVIGRWNGIDMISLHTKEDRAIQLIRDDIINYIRYHIENNPHIDFTTAKEYLNEEKFKKIKLKAS